MLLSRALIRITSLTAMILSASTTSAQSYPVKPIRIVTAEAGAGADFVSRLIAQGVSARLGKQVLVENRGGSRVIAAQAVSIISLRRPGS